MRSKVQKRSAALLISLVVLLCASLGGTAAYLVSHTSVTNVFTPATVACEMVGVGTNGTYYVKNTGDTDAYVRVAVVANWVNEEGTVYAQTPAAGSYAVTFSGDWFLGSDGYYYCKNALKAGQYSSALVVATNDVETPERGYALSVKLLASAVQATAAAVADWSGEAVVVSSTGELAVQGGG